jgi:hypothetical protein
MKYPRWLLKRFKSNYPRGGPFNRRQRELATIGAYIDDRIPRSSQYRSVLGGSQDTGSQQCREQAWPEQNGQQFANAQYQH